MKITDVILAALAVCLTTSGLFAQDAGMEKGEFQIEKLLVDRIAKLEDESKAAFFRTELSSLSDRVLLFSQNMVESQLRTWQLQLQYMGITMGPTGTGWLKDPTGVTLGPGGTGWLKDPNGITLGPSGNGW